MTAVALLAAGVYALDFLTKELIRRSLPLGEEIHLLPVFSIIHIENTGVAFGLFQGRNTLFLFVGLAVLAVIVWMAKRGLREDRTGSLIMGVIIGGALGNLTDRFMHGRVTDFLDFYIGYAHWPAFNVADVAICVGAALLLIREFRCSRSS